MELVYWPGWISLLLAAAELVYAVRLTYREARQASTAGFTPTLPLAVQAALLAGCGTMWLRLFGHPLVASSWLALLAFVVTAALGVVLVLLAGHR